MQFLNTVKFLTIHIIFLKTEKVSRKIAEALKVKPIVVFTSNDFHENDKVLKLLEDNKLYYETFNIDQSKEARKYLFEICEDLTTPAVFYGGMYGGGYKELFASINSMKFSRYTTVKSNNGSNISKNNPICQIKKNNTSNVIRNSDKTVNTSYNLGDLKNSGDCNPLCVNNKVNKAKNINSSGNISPNRKVSLNVPSNGNSAQINANSIAVQKKTTKTANNITDDKKNVQFVVPIQNVTKKTNSGTQSTSSPNVTNVNTTSPDQNTKTRISLDDQTSNRKLNSDVCVISPAQNNTKSINLRDSSKYVNYSTKMNTSVPKENTKTSISLDGQTSNVKLDTDICVTSPAKNNTTSINLGNQPSDIKSTTSIAKNVTPSKICEQKTVLNNVAPKNTATSNTKSNSDNATYNISDGTLINTSENTFEIPDSPDSRNSTPKSTVNLPSNNKTTLVISQLLNKSKGYVPLYCEIDNYNTSDTTANTIDLLNNINYLNNNKTSSLKDNISSANNSDEKLSNMSSKSNHTYNSDSKSARNVSDKNKQAIGENEICCFENNVAFSK